MFHSRYAIGILILVCVLMLRPVFNAYEKFQKSKLIQAKTQKEYSLVEDRRDLLDEKIVALGTLQGKEREVREKFGFVKEGEQLIVLVEEESINQNTIPRESVIKQFFLKCIAWFF